MVANQRWFQHDSNIDNWIRNSFQIQNHQRLKTGKGRKWRKWREEWMLTCCANFMTSQCCGQMEGFLIQQKDIEQSSSHFFNLQQREKNLTLSFSFFFFFETKKGTFAPEPMIIASSFGATKSSSRIVLAKWMYSFSGKIFRRCFGKNKNSFQNNSK